MIALLFSRGNTQKPTQSDSPVSETASTTSTQKPELEELRSTPPIGAVLTDINGEPIEPASNTQQIFGEKSKIYQSKNFGFQIRVPDSWVITEHADGVYFTQQQKDVRHVRQDGWVHVLNVSATTSLQTVIDSYAYFDLRDGIGDGYLAKIAPPLDESGPLMIVEHNNKIFVLTGWLAVHDWRDTFKFTE
jgi:hypothetical protein